MSTGTTVSVIIPVHRKSATLRHCLSAVARSAYPPKEVIVCDQSPGGQNADAARQPGVRHVACAGASGAAGTRNAGARAATGELLAFIDSDVVIGPETLSMLVAGMEAAPDIGAVFGAYAPHTPERNFASVYKNLYHCHTHRRSAGGVASFWTGCGCVRREAFEQVNGFDEAYTFCGVEDIDLGRRIAATGWRVLCMPEIEVVHLKRRTLTGLLWFDMAYTARRWARMIVQTRSLRRQLNTRGHALGSIVCAYGALACLAAMTWFPAAAAAGAACFVASVWLLNASFLRFLARCEGWRVLLGGMPVLLVFYLAAGAGGAAGVLAALVGGLRSARSRPAP